MFKQVVRLGCILMAAFCLNSYAVTPFHEWQEELMLHDGSKLVLSVAQRHAGQMRIGQPAAPIVEQVVSFSVPGESKIIKWRSTYGNYKDNLKLLAVDIVGQDVYIATAISGMDTKWQHPNPPYVFFKHDGNKWQRIPIQDFPAEIKEANVVVETLWNEKRLVANNGVVTSEQVRNMNVASKGRIRPFWVTFTRTPFEKLKKPEADGVDGLED